MSARGRTIVAVMCGGIAMLAGIAAGLGIFARGDGTFETVVSARGVSYEMATTGVYAYNAQRVVAEGIGWDIFTLVVAVPALLVAAPFVARGSFRGRLFAAGLLAYFAYQYLEYAVTWAFGPLFPIFIVLYAASLAGLVWIGTDLGREGFRDRFGRGYPRRSWVALSVTMATLLSLLWAQRIAIGLSDPAAAGLTGETTMVVQALDLGLVVPALVFIAVLVWRRSEIGYAMASIGVVAFASMAGAITGMLLSAWAVEGSPELVPITIFAIAGLSSLVIGIRMYRSVRPRPFSIEVGLEIRQVPAPAT